MQFQFFLENRVPDLIDSIEALDTPHWGMMSAHQMIEHIASTLSISNGNRVAQTSGDPERLAYRKMRFYEEDRLMPRNIKKKGIEVITNQPLAFPDLPAAKAHAHQMLAQFWAHFSDQPDATADHPLFGALNREEWIQFHARHLRHHFQQFGKLPIGTIEV